MVDLLSKEEADQDTSVGQPNEIGGHGQASLMAAIFPDRSSENNPAG
jgi:hypothetical protein